MSLFTEEEKEKLCAYIRSGSPLPEAWRHRLFPNAHQAPTTGKEYRLVYDGKWTREEVLARTPAAPWQPVREFCTVRPHGDGWRNLLVWGDSLMALRELLADQQGPNRFGTRGKIKLIYIDPPFATRQDFMKDKEKAYRDKVLGAQFIEFLRRRLILLREVLADDGSIYVHLDTKKGHYLKAVLDEVFGEENFVNEIVWKRSDAKGDATQGSKHYSRVQDTILFYRRSERMIWNPQYVSLDKDYVEAFYRYTDADGRRWKMENMLGPGGVAKGNPVYEVMGVKRPWRYSRERMAKKIAEGLVVQTNPGTVPMEKKYLDDSKGTQVGTWWDDISMIRGWSLEKTQYPTQKPESLIERVITTSSNPDDIILDCFAGSGTTAAVAEKLGRRWVSMDCGKLATYTTQKRLFSLTTTIGALKKDDRDEPERVEDWAGHLKGAPGVLLITEKARNGECEVTLDLLHDLAALVKKHDLLKRDAALSLVCPEAKLRIPQDQLAEPEDGPGTQRIKVGGVEFRLSCIAPKDKTEKEQPLPAKEFALYRAGIYDMAAIKGLPWADYRPFVLKLFGVRPHPHSRYGFALDGYIGTDSALLWNYPDHKTLTLDYGYVDELHRTLRGKPGERFHIIAPVVAMAFAEDEVTRDGTTYVFLKVPLSVLLRLIERKEPAALKQPAKEEDVNEVIDAVGFDFISQPKVVWKARQESRKEGLFAQTDYVVEIAEFRAQTLATDPEDFQNFETFSMAMVDLDYDGDVFRLSRVFWGEDVVGEEMKRLKDLRKTEAEKKEGKEPVVELKDCERIQLRIGDQDFTGEQMMVILCDRYGNEKALLLEKADFEGKPRRAAGKPVKKGGK